MQWRKVQILGVPVWKSYFLFPKIGLKYKSCFILPLHDPLGYTLKKIEPAKLSDYGLATVMKKVTRRLHGVHGFDTMFMAHLKI